MFAFAATEMLGGRDRGVTSVFLARDRFGIKPLYYANAGGLFMFASEVRALLASGLVPLLIAALGDLLPPEVVNQQKRTFPLGRMVARSVARTRLSVLRGMVAAARRASTCRSATPSVGIIPFGKNDLVASLGALRAQRMGKTESRQRQHQRRVGAAAKRNIRNPRSDVTASISL